MSPVVDEPQQQQPKYKTFKDSQVLEIRIIDERTNKPLTTFYNLPLDSTIYDVKRKFQNTYQHFLANRQRYRAKKDNQRVYDDTKLNTLITGPECVELLFKDLGPQISYRTVFIAEYAGPLVLFSLFYLFPSIFYRDFEQRTLYSTFLTLLWTLHYAKRLYETIHVHRFSHATMPIENLFKNCGYYWIFGAWIGYLVNHPMFTVPGCRIQIALGFVFFVLGEYGNLQCHLLFSQMRPKLSTVRKIPFPNNNIMTILFNWVSCANYTYEVLAWIGFSLMSQCLAAMLFNFLGFIQMAIWALSKHKKYKREFAEYPKKRKAIIPFLV